MIRKGFSVALLSATTALMVLDGNVAFCASGTWYGTNSVYANAYWTNSYNWSAQPYPSLNQTATFSQAGGGGRTTIDLTGLSSISNITFSSGSAYILGSNGVNQQTLVLGTNGIIQMSSSVGTNQKVNAKLQLGEDRRVGSYSLRNDHLYNVLTLAGDVTLPGSGTAGGKALTVIGIGNVQIAGNILTNGLDVLTVTNAATGNLAVLGESRFNTLTLNSGSTSLAGTNRISTLNVNSNSLLNVSGSNIVSTLNINGTGSTVINVVSGYLAFENGGGATIIANQDVVINGPGAIVLPVGPSGNPTGDNYSAPGKTLTINAPLTGPIGLELWSGNGTYVLNGLNSFTGNVSMGPAGTLSVAKIGNKGSSDSNLGRGTICTLNASGTRLLYTGVGETADRIFALNSSVIIDNSGTGHLKLTSAVTLSSGAKTLTLQGSSSGTAEFSAGLSNSSGTLSITKAGTGLWLFSGNCTYSGVTVVNAGTLSLSGSSGAIASSTGYTVGSGGSLLLDNTAAANNTNRLRDASAITLNGGTLNFSSDGGDASFNENAGTLTVNQNASTVVASQAAPGKTSTLRFASLLRTAGATVNFSGAGLGVDDRNRIFITAQADGLIGPWATVNGTNLAAYSSELGVYAAGDVVSDFTDIAARGPSTISDAPASNVRISSAGTSGPIELGTTVTRIKSLLQNTATAAAINTVDKTLQTDGIVIPSDKASVTVGQAANDGVLAPLTVNGDLLLNNDSGSGLTINAALADNGSSSQLRKVGAGVLTLAGTGTFSGTVSINSGSLVLANGDALQSATLLTGGSVFDASVASHAFTLGGLSGSFNLPLEDNAASPNAVALKVGKNGANTTYGGLLSGGGSLTKDGNGLLTLSGASTYSGGTVIHSGAVTVGSAGALGTGAVLNDATLNLTAGAVTYSGLSVALTGSGTNNVTLGTGNARTYLNGDYSGFTGVWNIGIGAAGGAGRAEMNGLDNGGASINVLSNATLWCYSAGTHGAKVTLNGGDTGESLGQLRLDNNVDWAGPVTLSSPITTSADGFLGAESGSGTISGDIGELGGPYEVGKVGSQTLILTGNNTFRGPVWVKAGTLKVPSINSVNTGAGPLGSPTNLAQGTLKLGLTGTGGTLVYTGNGETSDRTVDLAGTTGGAALNHSGSNTLLFTSDMISSGIGPKRLTLTGSTAGTGVVAGVIPNCYVTNAVNVYKDGSGTWRLAGDNLFTGPVGINAGVLVVTRSGSLGTGKKTVSLTNGSAGHCQLHLDGSEEPITLETNISYQVSNTADLGSIFNLAGTNTIKGNIDNTSGGGGVTFYSAADKLTFAGLYVPSATGRTLNLRGDGDGEVTGDIQNGLTPNLSINRDMGSGTWTLSNTNSFTGNANVSSGRLVVGGEKGALSGGVTVSGTGMFVLSNTVDANNPNRLRDTANVTLSGGTFSFAHAGGATNYSETIGTLNVNTGTNLLLTSQADVGQTSIVTFASLTHTANGIIDFQGDGLGVDDRNKVMFTTSPGDGLIGLWATYNTTNYAAYDAAMGVVARSLDTFVGLTAKGPATVTNDASVGAQINAEGTEGFIMLAGEPNSSLKSLMQNSDWASTLAMTNKTFFVNDLMIASGKQDLTVGSDENEGLVTPLNAGGTLTLINQSSNRLTLNAGVTNNTSASQVAKLGSGLVKLTGRNTYTGTTSMNEGELEFSGGSTQTLVGAISGAGSLVKSGSGTLTLSAFNTYTGPTVIKEGIVVAQNTRAFGTPDTGTVVISGATLDVGGSLAANTLYLSNEVFTVSGKGVGEQGAIVNNSANSQQNAFGKIVLAGDTWFGGAQRWDIRQNTPTLTMNGYDITKISTNTIVFTYTDVQPDGAGGTGDIDLKGGTLILDNTVKLNGSAVNTMTVRGGAQLQMYSMAAANPALWTLILENLSTISAGNGSSGGTVNHWAGPVILTNGTAFLTGANTAYSETFSGEISGPGSLVKTGVAVAYLNGTNNTYEGSAIVSNGTLYAKCAGALPGYATGKVSVVSGAMLTVPTGDGIATGWTAEQIKALCATTTFATNTATLVIDTTLEGLDYAYNFDKPMALTKQGANALVLNGTNTFTGALTINNGTLVLGKACSNVVGAITINNAGSLSVTNGSVSRTGNIVLNNTSTLNLGGGSSNVLGTLTLNNTAAALLDGGSTNVFGAVTLNGGVLSFGPGSTNVGSGTISVKGGTAGARMNIDGPVNIGMSSYNVAVATAANDRSIVRSTSDLTCYAIRMSEGTAPMFSAYYNDGGSFRSTRLLLALTSGNTYSYYRHSGGTANISEYFEVGIYGVGVMDMFSGTIAPYGSAVARISRRAGGLGVLNVFGGMVNAPNNANALEMSCNDASNPNAQLSVFGAGVVNAAAGTGTTKIMNMNAGTADGGLSVINLIQGGTLIANKIGYTRLGDRRINVDGGVLKAASGTTVGATFLQGLTAVTVYSGGLTFDTTNANITVNQALEAPAGFGVASVSLASGGLGYIGTPAVVISGGSGMGASAIATVDLTPGSLTEGQVTGVTVTSPGTGYEAGDVVLVSFRGGGYTNNMAATTFPAMLAPNDAGGGVSKLGTGTLTLGGTNTYGGDTVISNGTLKLASVGALPAGRRVVLAGGSLDLGGFTVTCMVSAVSGSITNGTLNSVISPAGANVLGSETLSVGGVNLQGVYLADVTLAGASDLLTIQGNINISGLTLEIVDPERLDRSKTYTIAQINGTRTGTLLPTNLPDTRWHLYYSADGKIKLAFVDGTVMTLR